MSDDVEQKSSSTKRRLWWLWLVVLGGPLALIGLLSFRSAVKEPFQVPAGSMGPTLLINDQILVNKRAYGWKVPMTRTPLGETTLPARGDVVVFVFPGSDEGPLGWLDVSLVATSVDYVKRVIALPGERVSVIDGVVTVNGTPLSQAAAGTATFVDGSCRTFDVTAATESDGARSWQIWLDTDVPVMSDFSEQTVPEGHLFVLGDNRSHSADSRMWGFVPLENLKGRVESVWMSVSLCEDRIREERIGLTVE